MRTRCCFSVRTRCYSSTDLSGREREERVMYDCLNNLEIPFECAEVLLITLIYFSPETASQGSVLQALTSFGTPEHCAPSPDGGGLVHVRERSCFPPPQVALHAPQAPNSVHPPFTIATAEKKLFFNSLMTFAINHEVPIDYVLKTVPDRYVSHIAQVISQFSSFVGIHRVMDYNGFSEVQILYFIFQRHSEEFICSGHLHLKCLASVRQLRRLPQIPIAQRSYVSFH